MKNIKKYNSVIFLLVVLIIYIVIAFLNMNVILESLNFFLSIVKKIIPVMLLVFVLMVLINYFIDQKKILKYFGEKSLICGWLIVIIGGLISHGPMYMWYPLFENMKNKGMTDKFIAAFLYNRAIKLPLVPLLVYYFGLRYTVVLIIIMIFASIVQGIIVENLVKYFSQ